MENEEIHIDMALIENKIGFDVIESLDEQWFYQNILTQADPAFPTSSSSSFMKVELVSSPDIPAIHPSEEAANDGAAVKISCVSEDVIPMSRSPSLPSCFGRTQIDHGGLGAVCKLRNDFPPRVGTHCSSTKLPGIPRPRQSRALEGSQCTRVSVRRNRRFKSLSDLEFEELKGFTDLGFVFDTENPEPCMVNVLPGLRRAGEEAEEVRRPYLSEAWLGGRSDFLVLRIPSPKSEPHMKSHLKVWAKHVASVVKQGY